MAQAEFENMGGYTVSVSGALDDDFTEYQIYKTDEYNVVSYQGYDVEYLWYEGWLYCDKDKNLTYRDMSWDEFNMEGCSCSSGRFAKTAAGTDDGIDLQVHSDGLRQSISTHCKNTMKRFWTDSPCVFYSAFLLLGSKRGPMTGLA